MTTTNKVTKGLEFEQALEELKETIKKIESDDLTLMAALSCYEKGVKLTNFCQDLLNSTEQKVSKLMTEKNKEWLSIFKDDNAEK
jgi:exodeoxyribonuclease VII small subunit|tara:strand:+ start:2792 stop:3046 length:255 start_codon:yes stop_codon:yes gene_type:complete